MEYKFEYNHDDKIELFESIYFVYPRTRDFIP